MGDDPRPMPNPLTLSYMNELLWMPSWPSQFSLLTAVALMLIAGGLSARLLSPALKIPETSAFLVCGLVLGPSVLGLVSAEALPGLATLADYALGLVLFELGRRVDPVWLVRERWALATSLIQGLLVFAGLFLALQLMGIGPLLSLMVAALGCAGSPAISLRISQELQAEGQVTERMLHAVVVQSLLGFTLFAVALQSLHISQSSHWLTTLVHPLYLLLGSAGLGVAASIVLRYAARLLGQRPELQQLLTLSAIGLLVEVNDLLKLAPMVSLLVFGLASRGYGQRNAIATPESQLGNYVVFAFLFVYLGSTLRIDFHITTLAIGVVLLLVRWLLLTLPTIVLARKNGLTVKRGALWGSALFPMSTVTVILVNHAAGLYPEFGVELANLVGSVLLITYVLGPLVTWWSLKISGEAKPNA
jgi:Kef-type K+ transport system membrane component KefB